MRISDWSSDVCSSDLRDQEFVFGADGRDFVIGIEDLGLVQVEAFDDVLVRVRVNGFFECLAQQELAAFGRRDVAVGAQHDVVRGPRVGRDEETDRKSVVWGTRVYVRLDLGGRVKVKKKK